MLLLIVVLLILLEASYEALSDNGQKTLSGYIEFLYRAIVTIATLLWLSNVHVFHLPYIPFWQVLFGYVLLRFAMFDAIYNFISKLPIFYVGSTKTYDKVFAWFFRWSGIPQEHFLAMFKIIALFISISWLI